MKKILATAILSSTLLLTGCGPVMEMQTQASTIDNVNDLTSFTVGKTNLEEVFEKLGGTPNVFNKKNNTTKYVWVSKKMTMENNINPLSMVVPFMGTKMETKEKQKLLILIFDEKDTLISKKLITKAGYIDPDMAKKQSMIMNNFKMPTTSM